MILLDTCALLWLSHNQENLSQHALERIDSAPIVYISAITGFEIGIKQRTGKLILPAPLADWINGILEHHDISVIDIDLNINIKATELPFIHKDPCDRFIIATAIINKLTVVTADTRFKDYGVEVII